MPVNWWNWPGYDKYLWIDADTWVQERTALEWFDAVATEGRLAIVPQVDRAYRHQANLLHWRFSRMQTGFGREAAQRSLWETYFNAGVFCLEAGAAHWQHWATHFRAGLDASGGSLCCDQSALNHAICSAGLPVHPLPALCNWLCHLATPYLHPRSGLLCEPLAPRQTLGIVHLSAKSKDTVLTLPGSAGSGGARPRTLLSPYG